MLARGLVATLNHLLAGESWARERLRPFSGQQARIACGPFAVELAVGGDGLFSPATAGGEPAVAITLPPDSWWRLAGDRGALFAAARLSGSADFAETLAFVFRNLRWDAEDDLAKLVGDIPARRLVGLASGFAAWQRQALSKAAANLGEYVAEEQGMVAARREVEVFHRQVADLEAAGKRLEQRLERLDP